MPDPLLGRRNTLRATARNNAGMLLAGGPFGEILLPAKEVPADLEPGGEVETFLYLDSEDRPVATTATPLAMAGEFAVLTVVDSTPIGAFLFWGLPKDLLLPFARQIRPLRPGDRELVYVYADETSARLVATAKLGRFVADTAPPRVNEGDEVSLQIADQSELGTKAIVDNAYWGLLPTGGSGTVPKRGGRCTGYITRLRDDGLVDVGLDPPGYARVPGAAEQLAEALAAAEGGFLPLHDKSPPEQVREMLGMSKKVFKQAAGALYKAGRIRLTGEGIQLLES